MRSFRVCFLLIASLSLCGCVVPLSSQQRPTSWATGFWFWQGSASNIKWSDATIDVLFVHVGTIRKDSDRNIAGTTGSDVRRYVYSELPNELPAAREYWLVFRYESQGVPDLPVAPMIAAEFSRLQSLAQRRHLNVAGVQLDIDSPTGSLAQYAGFLREVRKQLPPGAGISITALLDWFRSGTDIVGVIAAVDEFVPQFYDIGDRAAYDGGGAIASRIEATRWGPAFNRFGKRFRIGISTFGRARMVPKEASSSTRSIALARFFGDLAPIDVATNSSFRLQAARNQADELVLTYRASRKTGIGYNKFKPGDALQFVLSTPEAIRTATQNAREIGGHLAGVVFFRWPASDEALAMSPDEVLNAAGLSAQRRPAGNRIDVIDGHCAAVECVDIYLESADPYAPKPVRYRVRASSELEYFLPEQNMPVHVTSPSEFELTLPPYCTQPHLYLGRAVSTSHSEFSVIEEK